MTLKRLRPAPLPTVTGLGIAKPLSFNPEYPTFLSLSQEKVDAATLLAARYGIALETAKAHCEAFCFGETRS